MQELQGELFITFLRDYAMVEVKSKSGNLTGKRIAKRILPFFAPLFFASLTAP
jgi:hypothetical protein